MTAKFIRDLDPFIQQPDHRAGRTVGDRYYTPDELAQAFPGGAWRNNYYLLPAEAQEVGALSTAESRAARVEAFMDEQRAKIAAEPVEDARAWLASELRRLGIVNRALRQRMIDDAYAAAVQRDVLASKAELTALAEREVQTLREFQEAGDKMRNAEKARQAAKSINPDDPTEAVQASLGASSTPAQGVAASAWANLPAAQREARPVLYQGQRVTSVQVDGFSGTIKLKLQGSADVIKVPPSTLLTPDDGQEHAIPVPTAPATSALILLRDWAALTPAQKDADPVLYVGKRVLSAAPQLGGSIELLAEGMTEPIREMPNIPLRRVGMPAGKIAYTELPEPTFDDDDLGRNLRSKVRDGKIQAAEWVKASNADRAAMPVTYRGLAVVGGGILNDQVRIMTDGATSPTQLFWSDTLDVVSAPAAPPVPARAMATAVPLAVPARERIEALASETFGADEPPDVPDNEPPAPAMTAPKTRLTGSGAKPANDAPPASANDAPSFWVNDETTLGKFMDWATSAAHERGIEAGAVGKLVREALGVEQVIGYRGDKKAAATAVLAKFDAVKPKPARPAPQDEDEPTTAEAIRRKHTKVLSDRGGKQEYLGVAGRMALFRIKYPAGTGWSLTTELVHMDDARVMFSAKITDPQGRVIATGHGMTQFASRQTKAVEFAETVARGRALAAAGFGTDDIDEMEPDRDGEPHLADGPIPAAA